MTALTPAQEAIRRQAVEGLCSVLAGARQERAEIYARGGAVAVAEWVYVPGGPSVAELAAEYQRWVDEDRAAREAKAADAA